VYTYVVFLAGIAFYRASDSTYSYTFIHSVVCLSSVCLSVCRICVPCSSHSMNLKMPFGRYTCGVQWHIVLDGSPLPYSGKGDYRLNPQPKHAIANFSQSVSTMQPRILMKS